MVLIRPLQRTDARDGFGSGVADLDAFLRLYAWQAKHRRHVSTTYVAVEEAAVAILGYVTVTPGVLPSETHRGDGHGFPLSTPDLRIARLAVDVRVQGGGIGTALLMYAFELAVLQSCTRGAWASQ